MGMRNGSYIDVADQLGVTNYLEVYLRLTQTLNPRALDWADPEGSRWSENAADCAVALRIYADKYHPAESRALIPANVRAIFDMTPTELAREIA